MLPGRQRRDGTGRQQSRRTSSRAWRTRRSRASIRRARRRARATSARTRSGSSSRRPTGRSRHCSVSPARGPWRGAAVRRSSRPRAERGQILVIFVLALVAIIAGVGLVIDGGFAFAQRRAEQNAADLGAFAGANALLNGANPTAAARAAAAAEWLHPRLGWRDRQRRRDFDDREGRHHGSARQLLRRRRRSADVGRQRHRDRACGYPEELLGRSTVHP